MVFLFRRCPGEGCGGVLMLLGFEAAEPSLEKLAQRDQLRGERFGVVVHRVDGVAQSAQGITGKVRLHGSHGVSQGES